MKKFLGMSKGQLRKRSRWLLATAVAITVFLTLMVLIDQGYLPFIAGTEPYLPNNIPKSEGNSQTCEQLYTTLFTFIPEAESLTHDIFTAAMEPYEVVDSYKSSLGESGYSVVVIDNKTLMGNSSIAGYSISYGAFLEGVTAVVVIATPSGCDCGDSCVLYTTGAVWEYQPLLEKIGQYL